MYQIAQSFPKIFRDNTPGIQQYLLLREGRGRKGREWRGPQSLRRWLHQ